MCLETPLWLFIAGRWLYDWQTLVGAILAIVAAIIGSILLRSQLLQAERHESERRERSFAANRAVLPLVLSDVTGFSRKIISELASLYYQIKNPTSMALQFSTVFVSENTINSLKEFIENTYEKSASDCICEIIREVQILNSRVNDLDVDQLRASSCHEISEYIIQAGRLYLICGIMFPYSRGEVESLPETTDWEPIRSHLAVQHNIHEDDYPDVFAVLQRREAAWQSVWPPIRRVVP